MVEKAVRTTTTFVTALIAVGISSAFGKSGRSDVLTALLVAAFVLAVDLTMSWAPKHSLVARNLLDPRSKMVGVWLQRVKRAEPVVAPGTTGRNTFAVHWVEYKGKEYQVFGVALDSKGEQHAQWRSSSAPTFNSDGTVMSYVWEGEVLSPIEGSIKRNGVTRIELFEGLASGRGRSESVGENRILVFDITRVTPQSLAKDYGLDGWSPEQLKDNQGLRAFAAAYARVSAASAVGEASA